MFESAETESHEVHGMLPSDSPRELMRQALCRLLEERAFVAAVDRLRAGADPDDLIREAAERDDLAMLYALRSYLPAHTASKRRGGSQRREAGT